MSLNVYTRGLASTIQQLNSVEALVVSAALAVAVLANLSESKKSMSITKMALLGLGFPIIASYMLPSTMAILQQYVDLADVRFANVVVTGLNTCVLVLIFTKEGRTAIFKLIKKCKK